MPSVEINFPARHYQRPVVDYFRGGGKRGFEVWHRRAGKDRTATFIESELAFRRVGLYWHALPEYRHARRVIWDAITRDGKRLVDLNFPPAIVKKRNDQDMKIELVNGSIWQLVGADNFDSLVGANPVHVTFSEYALMSPKSWEFIRPILAENGGTALFLTTPRGYNHAYEMYQHAKVNPAWHCSLLTVDETRAISKEALDEERRTMPDELFRQEFYCDFSAANVGAILGRYVEAAEKSGRIHDDVDIDPDGAGIEISSDIGFRDTASFWFWQPRPDGFALVDYDEDTGLDASEWIPRLQAALTHKLARIWLPHDAKAKTFQTRHSVVEQFIAAFGADKVSIVPQTKKQDQINACRMVLPNCHFNRTATRAGMDGLRNWSFEWNEDTKTFSKEPKHDWASHPGDGFATGALVMRERAIEKKREVPIRGVMVGTPSITLEEAYRTAPKASARI